MQEAESAELAALLMRRTRPAKGLAGRPLVLHSDNSSAMKGATMLATLQNLGVMASFNRPRVSNDNPYAESAVPHVHVPARLPAQGVRESRRGSCLDAAVRSLVQPRVQTQWLEIRHAGPASKRRRYRSVGAAGSRLCAGHGTMAHNHQRWFRSIRNWELKDEVWLNPERMPRTELKQCA